MKTNTENYMCNKNSKGRVFFSFDTQRKVTFIDTPALTHAPLQPSWFIFTYPHTQQRTDTQMHLFIQLYSDCSITYNSIKWRSTIQCVKYVYCSFVGIYKTDFPCKSCNYRPMKSTNRRVKYLYHVREYLRKKNFKIIIKMWILYCVYFVAHEQLFLTTAIWLFFLSS